MICVLCTDYTRTVDAVSHTFLGIDGAGHYWDSYEHSVVVVSRDAESVVDAGKFDLTETPLATLGEWCEHVRRKRGWDIVPRVG